MVKSLSCVYKILILLDIQLFSFFFFHLTKYLTLIFFGFVGFHHMDEILIYLMFLVFKYFKLYKYPSTSSYTLLTNSIRLISEQWNCSACYSFLIAKSQNNQQNGDERILGESKKKVSYLTG